ncbi:CDP-glucose 4,6-dehydratase [Paenibacillus anaericanus]|uniref:CDP-glucose 4,6-dehydratase n=1 Tax=Paenibacillus anaericanus TaxID=170367 RepID=UPI0027D8310F|nr:CDP-glucose 4,6-dehydratase [Paenibacillus anaericanus]
MEIREGSVEEERGGMMVFAPDFWKGKKVLVTGHTGFKGSWLCLWLHSLGAEVTGYALPPVGDSNLFSLCGLETNMNSVIGDIRDYVLLERTVRENNPEIIIHMAAQPLVRYGYEHPVLTYEVNVIGTINMMEAVRLAGSSVRALVIITTDKCYENREWAWGYREIDRLGGHDPYSNSKACAELAVAAYRSSYYPPERYDTHQLSLATARAGNVIGGGDWSPDRIVPDIMRTLLAKKRLRIRNPEAIRPWQHVLEPLHGYLLLAQAMVERGVDVAGGWNFGPSDNSTRNVKWLVESIIEKWGQEADFDSDEGPHPHEAAILRLDSSKAQSQLGWKPRWNVNQALELTVEWFRAYEAGAVIVDECNRQIKMYSESEI